MRLAGYACIVVSVDHVEFCSHRPIHRPSDQPVRNRIEHAFVYPFYFEKNFRGAGEEKAPAEC